MYLSIIEFPSNFKYGVDVNSSVVCLKMLEVPSHYVYNFNSEGIVKVTVSGVFEDLKFKMSEGSDQN
jgi:hypothetical protein